MPPKIDAAPDDLDAKERGKRLATDHLADLVRFLYPLGGTPERWAEMIFGKADPKLWPKDARAPLNQETLEVCAKTAAAIAARWRD